MGSLNLNLVGQTGRGGFHVNFKMLKSVCSYYKSKLTDLVINKNSNSKYQVIIKGCPKKNVTRSKLKSVIPQEPNVLGGCPSHSL